MGDDVDGDERELSPLGERFARAGMPVTCLGWIGLFVALTLAHALAAALRGE